tara:strand:+ start:194 stop:472 length:279 start_codon:yes stop_codon:yes gene_type:complete
MSSDIKKTINRIILFVLSLPFAFVVLSPLLILYGIFLASYPEGRVKLNKFYKIISRIIKLMIESVKGDSVDKKKQSRSELWLICKNYWNGKN